MKKPIIITGYPRGGTSVVAMIFAKCGDFWIGHAGSAQSCETVYFDYENQKLKRFFRQTCTGDPNLGGMNAEDPKFISEVENIAMEDGYKGGPWLIKCGAAHVWPFIKTGHNIVFVDRDIESVKKHNISAERIRTCRVIQNHLRFVEDQQISLKTRTVFFVNYDDLIDGNYESLSLPFYHMEVPFNIPLIHGCIKPKWCHYKEGEKQ